MVHQFSEAHGGKQPDLIVVEPLALVALGLKKSVGPVWQGVKVECREIEQEEVTKKGKGTLLGVLLDTAKNQVVSCDLL